MKKFWLWMGLCVALGAAASGCKGGSSGSRSADNVKKPMYTGEDIAMIRQGLMDYREWIKANRIDPRGAMYEARQVPQAKDLANNFLATLINAKDVEFNRRFPPGKQPAEQARWLYEKEVELEGLKMVGSEADEVRKRVKDQYEQTIKKALPNRAAIDKAWRFPLRWTSD